ncbi:tRNA nucleotidyltransferase (CCA-adding enzyme) [Desulfohalotomaculum tongense]|uniref:CBS domain-containing protein n=1 Tax=Desulforadius tongensis TaxID=1216062 RepID=UPI001959C6DD|nr:CBS domain-containing protein [Desulforadius tongensis]MBM7854685.1 tRNA nucleotidyltransferase (CCA-adding enzyme) [Desulforadius tongensis]
MDIITTHTNTDFDGLAAMVAAQKLYPGADIVFPGKISRNVEEFLALHKDMLKIKPLKLVDLKKVRRLIVVDNHNPKRIGKLAKLMEDPKVEVHVYDHHPATECNLNHKTFVLEPLGAATTLLVERIRGKNIPITPLEATILALGIYDDTGCMVFASTTPRDVEAVAYLLDKGANLSVVSEFLGRPLTQEQQSLLKKLLVSSQRHNINGVKVLIASADTGEFIDGLALLTHKLSEIDQADAVFVAVEMEDRIHVVSRASVPEVNCREIMASFGGGGHVAAASASIKGLAINDLKAELLEIIKQKVRPMMTARDIMSSPVKTVYPETKIEEANQVMLRYGHTGLPVVRGLELVGVISRRDVEKAMHHGLGHAPVKAYMNVNVHTTTPDAPLSQVQDMMIEFDIGRLPVVENGRVVGIVSRSDVLRTLHGDFQGRYYTMFNKGSSNHVRYKNMMKRVLPENIMEILYLVGELAQQYGYKVYAGGGIVRDIILNVENLDVDLIVEGDAITLARALGEKLGGKVRTYEKFGTAEVSLKNGSWIDLATARVEFYEYPAALPTVETSSLKHDLYRRDFTINAMAISLNPGTFGELVDFFGGREDLYAGIVRVLHNLSFVEDPTRLLRAVRFEQRYQMHMDPQTLRLLEEAVHEQLITRVSNERIWYEMKIILNEPEPADVLHRLWELGLWEQIFPEVTYWEVQPVLEEIPQALMVLRNWGWDEPAEKWLVYFIAILHWNDVQTATRVCERYTLGRRQTEKVQDTIKHWRNALRDLSSPENMKISQLARILQVLPREAYPMFLALMEDRVAIQRFRKVMEAVRSNKPTINGKDLKAMGFKPGPLFRKALDAVWQARLDGLVKTREDELKLAEQCMYKLQKGEQSCV